MSAPWLPRFNWTDDALDRVKKLAEDGNSASEIASIIGGGLTRCAIIGKLRRAGLRGGGSRTPGRPPVRNARPGGASMSKPRTKADSGRTGSIVTNIRARLSRQDKGLKPEPFKPGRDSGGPIGPIVSLLHLNDARCRWPVGDPQHESFGYCGHPTKPESRYCAHHHARAFTPGSARVTKPTPAAGGYVCEPMERA